MTISQYRQLPLSVETPEEVREAVRIMLSNESIKRTATPLARIEPLDDDAGMDEIRGRVNAIIEVLNAIIARGA